MKQDVTAVFDIGKTNKKFFLFDSNFSVVHKEYIRLEETVDQDGFPTENLEALEKWIRSVFEKCLESNKYVIRGLNFSTYGASLVHLDKNGKPLTPLYNYLKPIPKDIIDKFENTHGDVSVETCAAQSGMLNSGMQLYWLKYTQPTVFGKIKYTLHLPQYLSYLFTQVPVSEYTSIGCHTALWDFENQNYHSWVIKERIDKLLPPIVTAETAISIRFKENLIKVGVGVHDSSSALIPYIKSSKKPFILVSTGTWSVSMNPYLMSVLTEEDIKNQTVNYMKTNGDFVKSAKFLLGKEYKFQIGQLSHFFNVPETFHKTVKFNAEIFQKLSADQTNCFSWKYLLDSNMPKKTTIKHVGFTEAYHQLMIELVKLQVENIKVAKGHSPKIKQLFVDGGFSDNDVFINLLTHHFKDLKVKSTKSSFGSALGACIVLTGQTLGPKFLSKKYALKKHIPFNLN
ncbi:carbohydrate kinase [Tamlana haliotis]|uniref:Carbohydrate kinase n=1 Tax=Pseudotamlana haliotis TaxID=2614804 RepID=A0A6N6MH47_9FLAO|nr:carbohydrate kinase [Tamlana haliotis]